MKFVVLFLAAVAAYPLPDRWAQSDDPLNGHVAPAPARPRRQRTTAVAMPLGQDLVAFALTGMATVNWDDYTAIPIMLQDNPADSIDAWKRNCELVHSCFNRSGIRSVRLTEGGVALDSREGAVRVNKYNEKLSESLVLMYQNLLQLEAEGQTSAAQERAAASQLHEMTGWII